MKIYEVREHLTNNDSCKLKRYFCRNIDELNQFIMKYSNNTLEIKEYDKSCDLCSSVHKGSKECLKNQKKETNSRISPCQYFEIGEIK